jgi:hypothetical protein
MIKIKVSTPWTHLDFNTRISAEFNPRYKFYFDDGNEEEFDFWIIWGDIKTKKETIVCPPQNIIYLTDEVIERRYYYQEFIDQFAAVITCRTDLHHKNMLASHELNTWMIQKDYDWLTNNDFVPKSKNISIVCSDHTWLAGHKKRFAFVNKLTGHFKDRIDVFGRGINPVNDKFDALAPYKYSIAIENSTIPGYFTEKITDCYLTHTMPVYAGCPDISDYFDAASMLVIDIENFKATVNKIEKLLEEDPYHTLLSLIKKQKMQYLEAYHIFNKLTVILDQHFPNKLKKEKVTIQSEATFQRGYSINQYVNRIQRLFRIPGRWQFNINFKQEDLFSNKP